MGGTLVDLAELVQHHYTGRPKWDDRDRSYIIDVAVLEEEAREWVLAVEIKEIVLSHHEGSLQDAIAVI
jgi:hypothetical protein